MSATSKTKGETTRERILEIAESAVLAKGFSNTSIDEIIAEAELTKSGFFYHFRDKTALAQALLSRSFEQDDQILGGIFERARELSDDPLHAFLIGLKMFAETMGDMDEAHPGCMVATVTYHDKQFNNEIRAMNRAGMIRWRSLFLSFLEDIVRTYPPRTEVDIDVLADMLSSTVEGGIVLSKVFNDPKVLADQILQYRTYVRLLFLGN
ncbi:TetR/AcrR family transcriptional regulator [Henriciella aquimarina]|uniref:TetR/AcrR family transcriptional regulator n=1 Tax=Henriciella aquimarina TaxID=545261 RepID=UPI0009FCAE56|nr:TetR/AcrR family transcriptional regulator [Henriciella aquimarina]